MRRRAMFPNFLSPLLPLTTGNHGFVTYDLKANLHAASRHERQKVLIKRVTGFLGETWLFGGLGCWCTALL